MNQKTFFKSKTGQITIFIILGIIILFVVALSVFWQNSFNKVRPSAQNLVVSDELKPIQVYVTDCLSSVSKDALIRLGQNGGYITLPSGLQVNPSKPYDSDALFFPPQVIPYWYYIKPCKESGTGCSFTRDPPLCRVDTTCILPYKGQNSMEEQLDTFVEKNLDACIANFAPFSDKFDITAGSIKVDSQIAESTVGFTLNYPLQISPKSSNKKEDISLFYTEHNLKLKQIYQFAQEIKDAEANYTFLEKNTLNLITIYSGIDEKLPPMSGLDMFNPGGKKIWIRTEVKNLLMSDILPYTMLLQIVNAGNAKVMMPRGTNPKYISFEEGLYKGMMIKVSNTSMYPDLNANIFYPPGSDIYFRIGNSEIIKPKDFNTGDNIILKMMSYVVNDYSFKYDITYPVIVRIQDPDAFKGEGYTFNYALQANIRQNVPISRNMTTPSIITMPTIDMEDLNTRVNRTITIETYDKYTKQPLEGVQINYKCGYDITMGLTSMKSGKAVLTDNFPFCEFGGEIDYEKAGYMGSAIDYTNNDGTDAKTFKIELWPLQEKKFKVYKRTVADINTIRNTGVGGIVLYNTAYSELSPNDTVFLNVYRTKDDVRETDVPLVGFSVVKTNDAPVKITTRQDQIDYVNKLFSQNIINESEKDSMLSDLNFVPDTVQVDAPKEEDYVMDFVPGVYTADAFMTYDGDIHIPEKNDTMCAQKIPGTNICLFGKADVNYPEQNFSSWISGGVNIDFTLTENDVYANNTLVFFVVEMPIPTNWDMLQNSQSLDSYQIDKIALLRPTVK